FCTPSHGVEHSGRGCNETSEYGSDPSPLPQHHILIRSNCQA
ncbi:hypothetical protein Tco_1119536, partial [Tanacetum coccineum]